MQRSSAIYIVYSGLPLLTSLPPFLGGSPTWLSCFDAAWGLTRSGLVPRRGPKAQQSGRFEICTPRLFYHIHSSKAVFRYSVPAVFRFLPHRDKVMHAHQPQAFLLKQTFCSHQATFFDWRCALQRSNYNGWLASGGLASTAKI